MILVQCIPRVMASIVTVLAIIALGFLGVLVMIGKVSGLSDGVRILVGIVLIAVAVLFACFLCFYRLRNRLIAIFLDWASSFMK